MSLIYQLNLLLLCCLHCSLAVSPERTISTQQNETRVELLSMEEGAGLAMRCEVNSSTQLTFITSLSVRGCPLFVHRVGSPKTGRFVLEPTFCIANSDSLRWPSAHYDMLTRESYLSFPVYVTNNFLLTEARRQLERFDVKLLSFLEVTSVKLITRNGSLAFQRAAFLWGPTEDVGHLRMVCDGFSCQSLALYLSRGQAEAFESLRLMASLRPHESCLPIERPYPVTIASAPLLPISTMQRRRIFNMRSCSRLLLFRVIQLDKCTAFVHQKQDQKGHYVIEPLLCPSDNFSLLTDYSIGQHYLKISAVVEDASVAETVRSHLASVSPRSVEFMSLWNATIHVASGLSQWKIYPLQLSTDRKSAELRAYCSDQASCELLGSVLKTEPVNFWKHIQWTATSVLDDRCEFKSGQRRFAFRMKEQSVPNNVVLSTGSKWSLDALRNRTVTRDGRTFIVVQQRGCRSSNFQRYWAEYVKGFGDDHNFWIGLGLLHSLTKSMGVTMRVEILLWNGTEWFAEYSGFTVGNSSTNYRMSYSHMVQKRSSLIYDALAHSRGYPFSSRDRDNVRYSSTHHCSRSWGGSSGWWFYGCSYANPNGIYHHGQTSSTGNAVWYFNEGYKSLHHFRMMLQL